MTFDLDRRTRKDSQRHLISPDTFFGTDFSRLVHEHGQVVAHDMVALGAPPLSIEVEGSTWTIELAGDTLAARLGATAGALVVTLSAAQFSDWAQNQISLNGFLVARALHFRGGTLHDVSVWDSLWLALLEGWPAATQTLSFCDRSGAPLDLGASFTIDDDPADIAHFLREAGYLHLRGWLDPAELRTMSADMDLALPQYVEGDGRSWWVGMADGTRRCVRMQDFVEHSPATARMLSSEAWRKMRRIVAAGDRLADVPVEGRVIEALVKPVGVKSGPSDVSLHRDCHLGRHSYACARITVGVPVTPTSAANGTLRVIAGSHRVCMPVEVAKTRPFLPVVALPTEPGDLTLHLSCTLHESLPPVFAERRVMYTEMPLEPLEDTGGRFDTSVGELREQVSDILRSVGETEAAV